jgi:hypothetical protein
MLAAGGMLAAEGLGGGCQHMLRGLHVRQLGTRGPGIALWICGWSHTLLTHRC